MTLALLTQGLRTIESCVRIVSRRPGAPPPLFPPLRTVIFCFPNHTRCVWCFCVFFLPPLFVVFKRVLFPSTRVNLSHPFFFVLLRSGGFITVFWTVPPCGGGGRLILTPPVLFQVSPKVLLPPQNSWPFFPTMFQSPRFRFSICPRARHFFLSLFFGPLFGPHPASPCLSSSGFFPLRSCVPLLHCSFRRSFFSPRFHDEKEKFSLKLCAISCLAAISHPLFRVRAPAILVSGGDGLWLISGAFSVPLFFVSRQERRSEFPFPAPQKFVAWRQDSLRLFFLLVRAQYPTPFL